MRPRKITYEVRDAGPAPNAGDWLESTRSAYVVLSSRAISTRDGARRFALVVVRVDDRRERDKLDPRRRFTLKWDKRDRRTR